MTTTSSTPLTVVKFGTEIRLDTYAYNISTKGGRGGMASLRGSSVVVPGSHGSQFHPGKRRDEGRAILRMWAQDTDVNGVPGAQSYKTWRNNIDTLLTIFDTSQGQIELRDYIDPTQPTKYRRAMVEVRSAIDPEILGRTFSRFTVECIINNTFWESGDLLTFTAPLGVDSVGTHDMTEFIGMTAPMEDAVIVVDGPITNPFLVDPRSGHRLELAQTVPNGQQWRIDSKLGQTAVGAGINFTPGSGLEVNPKTTAKGSYSPTMFGTTAELLGNAPKIQLGGTATGGNTRLRVQGRRKTH